MGAKRYAMGPAVQPLEATYSVAEVAAHFGCTAWQVHKLIAQGARNKGRGPGLYPTFRVSHKSRRIPASAIEAHKRAMAGPVAA